MVKGKKLKRTVVKEINVEPKQTGRGQISNQSEHLDQT